MLTFPYTPGLTYGETTRFDVQVQRHEDGSEQRYLLSRQRGQTLTYTFPNPSSGLVRAVESWFQGHVGPGMLFTVTDHRDGSQLLARFEGNALEHSTRAPQFHSMELRFHIVVSGNTEPVLVPFTRTAPPACAIVSSCYPVSTPSLMDPGTVAVDSGVIVGSGNSVRADSGADAFYWRQTSLQYPWDPWYIGQQLIQGTTFGTDNISLNRLYATPLAVTRSGATVGAIAVFVTAAANAGGTIRLGIYEQRSHATIDLYPGSLVADAGAVAIDAVGLAQLPITATLRADRLYFTVAVHSTGGSAEFRQLAEADKVTLGVNSAFTNRQFWVGSWGAGALPSTFPASPITNDANEPPAILVRFKS